MYRYAIRITSNVRDINRIKELRCARFGHVEHVDFAAEGIHDKGSLGPRVICHDFRCALAINATFVMPQVPQPHIGFLMRCIQLIGLSLRDNLTILGTYEMKRATQAQEQSCRKSRSKHGG